MYLERPRFFVDIFGKSGIFKRKISLPLQTMLRVLMALLAIMQGQNSWKF